MTLADLAGGVMPRSLHYRIERRQVAEFYELGGIRVCGSLHGHGENHGSNEGRRYTIHARCWAGGHRPHRDQQLSLLG